MNAGRCDQHRTTERVRFVDRLRIHHWYCSARWRRLRLEVLRAEPFCRSCTAAGRRMLTVDVDHIVKHNGDAALFWNRANLQGLCKPCHTNKTRRGE